MPTGYVRSLKREVSLRIEDAVLFEDSIFRFREIGVGIEARVEKSDGYAASGKSLVCIHSQRRRKNMIVLLKNKVVRIDLRLGSNKKLDAIEANASQLTRKTRVRLEQRIDVCVQVFQRNCLVVHSATKVAK